MGKIEWKKATLQYFSYQSKNMQADLFLDQVYNFVEDQCYDASNCSMSEDELVLDLLSEINKCELRLVKTDFHFLYDLLLSNIEWVEDKYELENIERIMEEIFEQISE